MVSETNDLLLKNDSSYPVFLDAAWDGKILSFTLYGTPGKEEIKLQSELKRTFPCEEYEVVPGAEDKTLAEPKAGSLYYSYRDYYKDGKFLRREKLRESSYIKVKGKKIIRSVSFG